MTKEPRNVIVQDVSTENPIRVLVLEEFRLRAEDIDGTAARIVADSAHGIEPSIPLMTSIDDRRDVATVRALHLGESTESDAAQHAALDPLVSRWAVPKHYGPRITESSQNLPSSFRMAVTESGINSGGDPPPSLPLRAGTVDDQSTSRAVGLVWIGAPVGTHAGLLVLVGNYDAGPTAEADPSGWPLPMSRDLGVRIYENNRA
jgi:hypothetical protein